jgi:hypothetical protein
VPLDMTNDLDTAALRLARALAELERNRRFLAAMRGTQPLERRAQAMENGELLAAVVERARDDLRSAATAEARSAA